MKYIFSFLLFITATCSFAQNPRNRRGIAQKKDSLPVLSCPLQNAAEPPPIKNAYGYAKQEGSITLVSKTDTTVRIGIDATVSIIQKDQEGKWAVVLFYKDYYFWYSGISKLAVKQDQQLKKGDVIGYIKTGEPIDVIIYDFETPMDPKKYLDCKK